MNPFQTILEEKGISLSSHQFEQFHTYYERLIEWNEKMNLTAITEKEQVYLKHFYDSLTPAFYFDFNRVETVCDVGAGAGFPSLPLKILFPHLKVSIVDALKKRLTFLETLITDLNFDNVQLYHDRAETFGQKAEHRGAYDLVTARAVAKLSVLSEYCLPLTKQKGTFIALKGASAEEEEKDAEKAVKILGGEISRKESLQLPEEESQRHLIFISKVKTTPNKYPRKPGTPAKFPL